MDWLAKGVSVLFVMVDTDLLGQCVVVKVQTVFVILLQICPPLPLVGLAASKLGDDL